MKKDYGKYLNETQVNMDFKKLSRAFSNVELYFKRLKKEMSAKDNMGTYDIFDSFKKAVDKFEEVLDKEFDK